MSLSPIFGAVAGCERPALAPAADRRPIKHSTPACRRVWAALTVPLKKFSAALQHRRELEQLARFSDRELRDLAVTRNDVDFALAEPVWRDPATSFKQARSGCVGQKRQS